MSEDASSGSSLSRWRFGNRALALSHGTRCVSAFCWGTRIAAGNATRPWFSGIQARRRLRNDDGSKPADVEERSR